MPKIVIKVKEEYLALVPRPTKEEYNTLKDSIKLNGQYDPIVINRDGFILDGHTRFDICQSLGIEAKYRIQDFADKEQELQYVVESNVNKRQLNPFQKIETFRHLFEVFKERAKENQRNYHSNASYAGGGSIVQYASSIGVGQKSVQHALYILDCNILDIITKCRKGILTINQAHNMLKDKDGRNVFREKYIKNDTKIICPKCEQISKKKEWKKA